MASKKGSKKKGKKKEPKLTGPKSRWRSKKLGANEIADLKIVNQWAKALFRWATIITAETRRSERLRQLVKGANHIPDPPDPPFTDGKS